MSNDSRPSLSSSLWRVTIALLGLAVAVWLAVTLIEQIWATLLIILGVVAVIAAVVVIVRWWLERCRW